jgi:hypothetical protein
MPRQRHAEKSDWIFVTRECYDTCPVSTSGCTLIGELVPKVLANPQFGIPQNTVVTFFEAKGFTEISPSWTISYVRGKFQTGEDLFLSIRVQSIQSSQTSQFLETIISDPRLLVEESVIETVFIDGHKIPFWRGAPNMLLWKLKSGFNSLSTHELMYQIKDTCYAVMAGPSMSGKTRLVFETLFHSYGIYFTFDEDMVSSVDFNLCIKDLEGASELSLQQRKKLLQNNVRCLISARLSLLKYLLEKFPTQMSCEKWLMIQLKFDFTPIYHHFKGFADAVLIEESQQLNLFGRNLNPNKFLFFIDDAHVAVPTLKDFFPSSKQGIYRSLYRALVGAIEDVTYDSFICSCGSGVGLKDIFIEDNLISDIAKDDNPVMNVSDTFNSVEEMNLFMRDISPYLKFTEIEGKIFKGRVGFLCRFIEFFLYQRMIGLRNWSLSDLILHFLVDETQTVRGKIGRKILGEELLEAVEKLNIPLLAKLRPYIYYSVLFGAGQKEEIDFETAWIFEYELGSLWVPDDSFRFTIDQPIILISCLRSLLDAKNSPHKHLFHVMCENLGVSALEVIRELQLCMLIMDSCSKNCNSFLKDFAGLNSFGRLNVPNTSHLISTSDTVSFSDYLETRPTAFYVPKFSTGPEIVFNIQLDENSYLPVFIGPENCAFFSSNGYIPRCFEFIPNSSETDIVLKRSKHLWAFINLCSASKRISNYSNTAERYTLIFDRKSFETLIPPV